MSDDKPKFELCSAGGQWTDLSSFVSSVDLHSHDDGAGKADTWGDYLAGLEPATLSLTLDNRDSRFTPFGDLLFPATPPITRVSYEHPDGRWQRIKLWFRRHGLKWLKVRYVTYSFDAQLETHQIEDEEGTGFEMKGHAVGPITKGLETR